MKFDPEKSAIVDGIIQSLLEGEDRVPDAWLLEQSLITGPTRRALHGVLMYEEGSRVLDAGCGFGVDILELAGQLQVEAVGLDQSDEMLSTARRIQSALEEKDFFVPGSTVELVRGDVEKPGLDPDSFDLVTSTFVFQYLNDPVPVCEQLATLIKPGGHLCIIDVDDQLSLVYPEPSDAYSRLSDSFNRLQAIGGGDRNVGRKLAGYLDAAGFEVAATLVFPMSVYKTDPPNDPGKRFLIERFTEAKDGIVANSLMSEKDFEDCLSLYASEKPGPQFKTNSQVIAIGKKPE